MFLDNTADEGVSMPVIECGLAAISSAVVFLAPSFASNTLRAIERSLACVARRRVLAALLPGVAVVLLRLALLPILPIPLPMCTDDFSFLLASDTFASGRLTNPTPPMWVHFETIHVTMIPSYMSMYFPAQGLLLAAGKVLLGHPWFGVLITAALFCSALCWMLQVWLPPSWAFLGSMLAVVRIGLFSYWVNTYHSAGLVAGLGGALVLGAMPRYVRSTRVRNGLFLAVGIALLILSRPYEGMLLCIPVAVVLARWLVRSDSSVRRLALQSAVLPIFIVVAAGSWLAYYDYRAFGNALTLPYSVDRATYAIAPYYVWQPVHREPAYRHAALRNFYVQNEFEDYKELRKPYGLLSLMSGKAFYTLLFFAGFALLVPLIMLRRALMDHRIRFLVICGLVAVPGMLIQNFLLPHYLAPFTALSYAIGLQCMRHLRVWKPEGRRAGMALARACVMVCLALMVIRVCAKPLRIDIPRWPAGRWNSMWYGPEHYGTERVALEETLLRTPGKHLALVRYADGHEPLDEWVYNAPDIDGSKVIWARDMDAAGNAELLNYYRDRQVWLVQPDLETGKLSPYPATPNENHAQVVR